MSAENTESCLQRDSAERKGYVRAHRSFNRIWKERDSAEPDILGKVLEKDNLNRAYKRVKANKGAPGIDGMTVEDALPWLKEHNHELIQRIRSGHYTPSPVRRKKIPKPDGGVRKLGIPTVIDRIIQQAMAQQLMPIYEPLFSDGSYGYRPGRSAKDAILKIKGYAEQGYTRAVVLDLSKYFDTLNHELLINILRRNVKDERVIQMVKRYLKSGVMENGVVIETEEGSPQGGNLSPLLSNIMLNELDKELEARSLHFVRYADDCVIAVGSSAAANRVMNTITKWIEKKLGLKVNMTKTKVTRPTQLKYLGFGFVKMGDKWEARPHKESIQSFERKLKRLTNRSWSISMDERIQRLNWVIRGWINYFRIGKMKNQLIRIDGHLRTRMRIVIWKQWKTSQKRYWGLRKLGAPEWMAKQSVGFADHYQAVAKTTGLHLISKEILAKRGLLSCVDYYLN